MPNLEGKEEELARVGSKSYTCEMDVKTTDYDIFVNKQLQLFFVLVS